MITLACINNYIELLRIYYTFFSFTFEVAFESSNVFSHNSHAFRCHTMLYCIVFTLTNLRLYSIQSITES